MVIKNSDKKDVFLHWLTSLLFLGIGCYLLYRIINHDDVRTYINILDLIAATIWVWNAIDLFIEGKRTEKQRIKYWLLKEKPKGFLYFIFLKGILKWTIPSGIFLWVTNPVNKHHPISTGILQFIIPLIVGIYFGRLIWKTNVQKSKKFNLEEIKL